MGAKRSVYLGTVAVVPRADLKRHLERPMAEEVSDTALRSHLQSVLSLAKAPSREAAAPNDCALDVFVAKHQGGEAWEFSIGELGLPLFWRPAVEVASRLYTLRNNKPIATVHIKKCLPWREFIGRLFSVRGLWGFQSPFTREDISRLVDEALFESLSRVRAKL